ALASVRLEAQDEPPEHIAAWLGASAGVPAIRPHMQEHSSSFCRVATPMHVVSSWPHMHRIGKAFRSTLVRRDGSEQVLVDLPDWSFDRQETYPLGLDVAPGDSIVTACT